MRILQAALLMAAQLDDINRHIEINKAHKLHEAYNQRNLQGTMSRHKAKMKCKKYCQPKKRK